MDAGIRKIILLVLDSLGVGEAPDSFMFNDRGTNTLSHVADANGGLKIPNLAKLGLSNITYVKGSDRLTETTGFFGKIRPRGINKDSLTGHWEMSGIILDSPFLNIEKGLSYTHLKSLRKESEISFIGNQIIPSRLLLEKHIDEHIQKKLPILKVANESTLHLLFHEDAFSFEEAEPIIKKTRKFLDSIFVVRLIVEFYEGSKKNFKKVWQKEILISPDSNNIIHHLSSFDIPVHGIGKIRELFQGAPLFTSHKSTNNEEAMNALIQLLHKPITNEKGQCLIFANFPDFDSLYAHSKDPYGYAKALEKFDSSLPKLLRAMENEDLLIITADHGSDPTHPENRNSREYLPLLVYSRIFHPQDQAHIGVRSTLADIAMTIAEGYDINIRYAAESFWDKLVYHL